MVRLSARVVRIPTDMEDHIIGKRMRTGTNSGRSFGTGAAELATVDGRLRSGAGSAGEGHPPGLPSPYFAASPFFA